MSPAPHADRDHSEARHAPIGCPCDCGDVACVACSKPWPCATSPEAYPMTLATPASPAVTGYVDALTAALAERDELRAKVERLRGEVDWWARRWHDMKAERDDAEAGRDLTRSLAATLEAQLAQVEALHVAVKCGCGCDEMDCETCCGDPWPCSTVAILHPEESA